MHSMETSCSLVMHQTRSAIAMNNIGVSLLERSCYTQALETLRDALFTLKYGLNATDDIDCAEPCHEVAEKLQRATHRLMNPEPQQGSIQIDFISSECLAAKALNALKRGPSSHEACAIRIDTCNHETLASYPTVETAILLHNFAISYLCLASAPHFTRPGHLKGAMTLLAASYNVLQTYRHECACDSIPAYNLLSLESIVLGSLIAVLIDANQTDQARMMFEEYKNLTDVMKRLQGLEECFQNGQHGAAAA